MFAAGNKVCGAHVGRQHGLFNQSMRHIAGTRNDFLNSPYFIANDLCLSGLKINRTAYATLFEQRLVHIVQIKEVWHKTFTLSRFWPTRVGQNSSYFSVSKARLAEHHCRVKLVGMYLALSRDQHVAHHTQALNIRVQRT